MLQPERIGGVKPNVSLCLQLHHNNKPNSSSEESINRLLNNIGESADQPQLSEAQSAAAELLIGGHHSFYRPLYNAAQRGDWKSAKSFIQHDPNALTARITLNARTVAHIAAVSCQWDFVLNLLESLSPESIALQDSKGNTVLHYVAQGGSLKTAKALVKKNPDLPHMVNNLGDLPLLYSIFSAKKEMVMYFCNITIVESPGFAFIQSLPKLLRNLIQSGYLDIALFFVRRYPNLALANDEFGTSLLFWLANNPSYFFSRSNLGFWERWIYKFVQAEGFLALVTSMQSGTSVSQAFQPFKRLLWKAIALLAPSIKLVRDAKLKHESVVDLINHVCAQLASMSFQEIIIFLQNPVFILGEATVNGIEEIVKTLLEHFPDLIYFDVISQRNILQVAIEYRQEKIFNIIKDISPATAKELCSRQLETEGTTLHLVGKLAPAFKLFSVSGAAFQMQRELQWFKEVGRITCPVYKQWKDKNDQTAKDVFRTEHKELAEKGEKWMKDTANSCMLVSTLIATVLFAAAFAVPGGNLNDKGVPIFLRTDAFTIFAISNALGLFSSLTSLLMFLAILTARYAVDDFLESLPKKLILGLGSLFIAIAAMIIAFGATLVIVLQERWHCIFVPVTLFASFPVAIFVMLQLPLFVQMVQSTYGASMFHP